MANPTLLKRLNALKAKDLYEGNDISNLGENTMHFLSYALPKMINNSSSREELLTNLNDLKKEYNNKLYVGTRKKKNGDTEWASTYSTPSRDWQYKMCEPSNDDLTRNLSGAQQKYKWDWQEAQGPTPEDITVNVSPDFLMENAFDIYPLLEDVYNRKLGKAEEWAGYGAFSSDKEEYERLKKAKPYLFVDRKDVELDPLNYTDESYAPWIRGYANKLINGED